MNDPVDVRLNEILSDIEFPGEDGEMLLSYLQERHFIERVMAQIHELHRKSRKTLLWGVFCLLNLILLVIFGTSQPFVQDFFALQKELAQFFFLFLGLTFLGSLIGLVLSLDTSWFEHYRHRDA